MREKGRNSGRNPAGKVGWVDVLCSIRPLKIKVLTYSVLTLFWVMGCIWFVLQRIPGAYEALRTPIELLFDVAVLILGVWTLRNRWDIAVVISYLVISLTTTLIINGHSIVFWLNGSRMYFSILFMLPIFRWLLSTRERSIYFITRMDKSIYIFLWIQLPCVIYQYLAFGGGDYGGGSLGNLNSGTISTLIYAMSFYLMLKRWDNEKSYMQNLLNNRTLIFLLLPSFMNETKISFVYLVLYFLFLVPFNRRFLINMLYVIPAVVLMTFLAGYVYLQTNEIPDYMKSMDFLEYYVIGDEQTYEIMENLFDSEGDTDENRDFMRGAKFLMLPTVVTDKPHGLWLGYGASQFKGGTVMEQTHFAKKYEWFLYGTSTQLMQVQLDMGLLGDIWLLFYMCVLFGWIGKGGRLKGQMQWFLTGEFIFILIYASFLSMPIFALPYVYLVALSSRWNLVEDTLSYERKNASESDLTRLEG